MGDLGNGRYLLDSHGLLWWDNDLARLSAAQRRMLEDRGNVVYVSAATVWELGIKSAKKKLTMQRSVTELVEHFGFRSLAITMEHASRAAELPQLHGDPFDRMLVAQAMLEELTLVTVDPTIARYGVRVLV